MCLAQGKCNVNNFICVNFVRKRELILSVSIVAISLGENLILSILVVKCSSRIDTTLIPILHYGRSQLQLQSWIEAEHVEREREDMRNETD